MMAVRKNYDRYDASVFGYTAGGKNINIALVPNR